MQKDSKNIDKEWFTEGNIKIINTRAPLSLITGKKDNIEYEEIWKDSHSFIQNDAMQLEFSVRLFMKTLDSGEMRKSKDLEQYVYNSMIKDYKKHMKNVE